MSEQTEQAPDQITVEGVEYIRVEKRITQVEKRITQAEIDAATAGKMKHCPWCCGKTRVWPSDVAHSDVKIMVGCSNIGCSVQPFMGAPSIEEAIRQWNARKGDK